MMRQHHFTALVVLFLGVWATGLIVIAQEQQTLPDQPAHGGYFDTEQQTWVDITDEGRELMQQLQQQQASGVCQDTFIPIPSAENPLLCISFIRRGPSGYQDASLTCRMLGQQGSLGRIATYEDLSQVYLQRVDLRATFSPRGVWLGHLTGDNQALCGNQDIPPPGFRFDFDGTCNRRLGSRIFFCAHDPFAR
jgi:hypothetical protein